MVPECQCNFRRARSTTYMDFVARLLQDKCIVNNFVIFSIAFIDPKKAFETVNRDLLWRILGKFGASTFSQHLTGNPCWYEFPHRAGRRIVEEFWC